MNRRPLRIGLIAGEASGDALGAGLAAALLAARPGGIEFFGQGGDKLKRFGVGAFVPPGSLSVLGLFEALTAARRLKAAIEVIADGLMANEPDVVVAIDSFGLSVRIAQALRARGYQGALVKYVAPQIWATRADRAATLAGVFDHLLALWPMDAPFFDGFDIGVDVVGHPMLDGQAPTHCDQFRARWRIGATAPVLVVLLGSRSSELNRIGPVFAKTVERLIANHPDLVVLAVLADSLATEGRAFLGAQAAFRDARIINEADRADAFAVSTAALACSGTIVTELLAAGVPTVSAYKVSWPTYAVLRLGYFRARYFTLANIATNAEIVPEYGQARARADLMAGPLTSWLTDPAACAAQPAAQTAALDKLRPKDRQTDASARAAQALLAFWEAWSARLAASPRRHSPFDPA
ncbi:MAG: lipid-A-disaccharide synthase [Maricaulaceae bacterium]